MDKPAVVDVIDIRKRIEKIRNEVSEAIVSQAGFEAREESLREDISLAVAPSGQSTDTASSDIAEIQDKPPSDRQMTMATHRAMTQMMAMPSFTLNVKSKQSNPLLVSLFALQLVTNIIVIAVLLITSA